MSDLGDTPYDRGYVNGYNHGKSEAEDVAQAMVAAAYEAAAQTAFDHTPTKHGGAPLVAHVTGATIEREIRALTPADARDALDRRDRQMRAEGMREAAVVAGAFASFNMGAALWPGEIAMRIFDLADKTEKGGA